MYTSTTFNELLAKARGKDFYGQQKLMRFVETPENQIWSLIPNFQSFLELAGVNDSLTAKLVGFVQIRYLIKNFANLLKLALIAPETVSALLNYTDIRLHIGTFKQLLQLFNTVEVLKITLPPHQEIRVLVKTPSHLEQLSRLRINAHSNSNLDQLFISYADIRKRFTSFKQLLQFIANNPSASQLFIKDEHTISLIKNAKQLTTLLKEISKFNPLWSKNAALEFSHSDKVVGLFKRKSDLLDYLSHLPDQDSIRKFIDHYSRITSLIKLSNSQKSMLEMEFFKAKKFQLEKPSIPLSLLQYA